MKIQIAAALAAALAIGASVSATTAYADSVSVTLKNTASFDYNFEVKDLVCGTNKLFKIASGGTRTEPFCSSGVHDSGYAKFIYRKQGNSGWTERSLISHGDTVTLN